MPVSISAALTEAAEELRKHGIIEPRLDASLLLSHVLQRDRAYLIAHNEQELRPDQLAVIRSFVDRRANGEPLQYLTNHQEFFKLDFEVTPAVLIPRPETELLVEAALDVLLPNSKLQFADLGTGSGCVAISILHERVNASATAIDRSDRALDVARRNAERHGVTNRLELVRSDLFTEVLAGGLFDLIVSNPPYVSDAEMKTLQPEVKWEPVAALAGGPDGLAIIRRLLNEGGAHLKTAGYLIFEIGLGQGERIQRLIDKGVWRLVEVRRDLAGIPRTVVLQKKSSGS